MFASVDNLRLDSRLTGTYGNQTATKQRPTTAVELGRNTPAQAEALHAFFKVHVATDLNARHQRAALAPEPLTADPQSIDRLTACAHCPADNGP